MSVLVNVTVLETPYGNPGSVGEPMGLWIAGAVIVGDATGGRVQVTFRPRNPTDNPTAPDARREYVYFCDGIRISSGADPGNMSVRLVAHFARGNVTLSPPFSWYHGFASIADGVEFVAQEPPVTSQMARMPIFWDTQELASGNAVLAQLVWENNVNAQSYTGEAFGRYYRKEILSNRAFGRLVSPVAMSQFEG